MMRVKLLSEKEYAELGVDRRSRDYDESQFYELLREKGDFTDKESLALLRHLHGEACVAEKWYRRTTADGKTCLPAISREAMYGLVVIENSRKGLYTEIVEDFTGFETERRMEHAAGGDHNIPLVWQAFAKMDLDILLTFRKKDFDFSWDIDLDVEFILEGYPINGVPTAVHVIDDYLREPALREGEWYIHNFFYDDKYDWAKDTQGILDVIHNDFMGQRPLVKGVFTVEQFEEMCWPENTRDGMVRLSEMEHAREKAEIMGVPCEEELSPWKVVNHMDYLPEEGDSRRLLYLIIEEYDDGHFCLRDTTSVKYPSYREMFCEAQEMKKPECELFMVPVDVNECMGCAKDIRKAVCAFRVVDDVIETFGPEDGLRAFEKTLRRAVESGRCTSEDDGMV